MVYGTWDYWVLGLSPSSDILRNKTFWKLDLFLSSGEGVGDTYSSGSVEKNNLSHWTIDKVQKPCNPGGSIWFGSWPEYRLS
jgi:hypothetical protein